MPTILKLKFFTSIIFTSYYIIKSSFYGLCLFQSPISALCNPTSSYNIVLDKQCTKVKILNRLYFTHRSQYSQG